MKRITQNVAPLHWTLKQCEYSEYLIIQHAVAAAPVALQPVEYTHESANVAC